MADKPPTIAETFLARRIAEFPTLYPHRDQVIFSSVIGTQGSCYWDKNGCLKQKEQHYNPKTKKYTRYPLQMPMATAYSLLHSFGKPLSMYYNMSGPINQMPVNIEKSWLEEIDSFLYKWGKFSMDDFKLMATNYCLLQYGCRKNPHAYLPERTITDFKQFHANIPKWKAMVESIRFQKQHGKINQKTYQGSAI